MQRNRPAALGSKLVTVTMNRHDIVAAYPELIRAAEGPVMDSSAACLMRLARAVHSNGYKVVLTGEGADEALAGYAWFKTEKIRNMLSVGPVMSLLKGARSLTLASIGGGSAHRADLLGIKGARTAQQDVYDFMGQARSVVYSPGMWRLLEGHAAYDDLDLPSDRFARWHPLNQSLYVGYKVMLAGLLLLGKGDRVAMNSSVETRYPLLDEDLISFCCVDRTRIQAARTEGQMAAPSSRGPHAAAADRESAQDDVPGQPVRGVFGSGSPRLDRSAPEQGIAPLDGLVRSGGRGPRACGTNAVPADHAQADHHGPQPDLRRRDPALAPPLPGRRTMRAARRGSAIPCQRFARGTEPLGKSVPNGHASLLRGGSDGLMI